jgi:hypothetical protein
MKKAARARAADDRPRCGLCGKRDHLTRTECCGQWICDDEDSYVLFSYARNSCYRNHNRYTLCGHHYEEGHGGHWKNCPECREDFQDELEMYVYYGTNEYNFEKLRNPPKYQPTHCSKCGAIIVLSEGGYSYGAKGYLCGTCTGAESAHRKSNRKRVLRPHIEGCR